MTKQITELVRILGIQRAGTNLLEHMIDNYVSNTVVTAFKKHDFPKKSENCQKHFKNLSMPIYRHHNDINERPEKVCAIVKEPYAHFISLKKHYPDSDLKSIVLKWQRENNYIYEISNSFENSVKFVRYINLINNPTTVIHEFCDDLFSDQCNVIGDPCIPKTRMTSYNKPESSSFSSSYYLEEKFMEEISNNELSEINKVIDHNLVEKLGYSIR